MQCKGNKAVLLIKTKLELERNTPSVERSTRALIPKDTQQSGSGVCPEMPHSLGQAGGTCLQGPEHKALRQSGLYTLMKNLVYLKLVCFLEKKILNGTKGNKA